MLIKPGWSNPAEGQGRTVILVIIASLSQWFTPLAAWCIFLQKLLTVHKDPNFPYWPHLIGPIRVTPWFTVRVDGWHGQRYSQLHSESGASPGHSFTFTHCQHSLSSRVTRPVRLHLAFCVSRWWSAEEENGHSCIWAKNVSVTKCHNRWYSWWGWVASLTYKVSKCQWGVWNKQYTLWRLYTHTYMPWQ